MYRNTIKNQTNFKAGYSPRSSLRLLMTEEKDLLNKVTLGLDRHILNSLKKYFHQDGLTQIEFIQSILKGIQGFDNDMPQRKLRLINTIHTMYEDITMGGSDKITWEIFSNYLINNIRHVKNKQEIPYTFSKSNQQSSIKFDNPIAKSIYIQELGVTIMSQQNSNKVHVLDSIKGMLLPHCLVNQPRKLKVQTSVIKKQKGKTILTTKQLIIPTDVIVMDLLYLSDPKFNVILCSTSDGIVKGWRLTLNGFQPALQPQSQNLSIEHSFPSSIYSMAWDNINQVLYCGSQKGIIYEWPFKTDTEHPLQGGHQSIVMCMQYISKLQILASGDIDGKMILWDIVTESKKVFKIHNRGILNMVLSDDLLIFTAGFDHQICVWNPYISGLAHKINIHNSTVLSMALNSNYLFSLDAQNQVKITSLKTFQPVYIISSKNNDKQKFKNKISCISLVLSPMKLLSFSTRLQVYDYDQDKNADLSDNIPLFYTFYYQDTFKLFACTTQRIKVWNMLTGQLQQTFSGLSNYQISCIVFESSKRYIVIGDTMGYVNMFNMKSCSKIKQLPRQSAAVDHIIFIPAIKQHNLLAIVSGYSTINIYKIIPQGYQLTKTFHMSKNNQITTIKYNTSIRQLIIGNNFGSIQLYDVEKGKMIIGTNSLDIYSNIVMIQIIELDGLTLILEVSYMGIISILIKLQQKLERIHTTRIYDTQNKSQFLRISAACWDGVNGVFLGDEKGYIIVCDLENVLYQIKTSSNIHKFKKQTLIIWRTKAHQQSILHLRSIQSESLLLSSAYDRKIKVWNASTGEFIDHFRQQQFQNQTAAPIFYWRVDQKGKYDIRKSNITEQAVIKTSIIQPKDQDLAFNPQWLYDNLSFQDSDKVSNKYWKLNIKFTDKIRQKIQKCQQLLRLLLLKKKNTKFQLILKQPSIPTTQHLLSIQATSRASIQKHKRYASNISQQLSPRIPNMDHFTKIDHLPQLGRSSKLDLISRAQMSAHKKFKNDIAVIDNELKHQLNKNTPSSRTHNSLNKRKTTILSQYQSKQFVSNQYKSKQQKGLINLSGEEISALGKLSEALKNLEKSQKNQQIKIPSKTIRYTKK